MFLAIFPGQVYFHFHNGYPVCKPTLGWMALSKPQGDCPLALSHSLRKCRAYGSWLIFYLASWPLKAKNICICIRFATLQPLKYFMIRMFLANHISLTYLKLLKQLQLNKVITLLCHWSDLGCSLTLHLIFLICKVNWVFRWASKILILILLLKHNMLALGIWALGWERFPRGKLSQLSNCLF